jgi:hypothetical protein
LAKIALVTPQGVDGIIPLHLEVEEEVLKRFLHLSSLPISSRKLIV